MISIRDMNRLTLTQQTNKNTKTTRKSEEENRVEKKRNREEKKRREVGKRRKGRGKKRNKKKKKKGRLSTYFSSFECKAAIVELYPSTSSVLLLFSSAKSCCALSICSTGISSFRLFAIKRFLSYTEPRGYLCTTPMKSQSND